MASEITGYKVIASGTQSAMLIDPVVLFRNALLLGAAKIIIAHNHPSGNVAPSADDIDITQTLIDGAKTLNLQLLDHIIYTPKTHTSLKAEHPDLFL